MNILDRWEESFCFIPRTKLCVNFSPFFIYLEAAKTASSIVVILVYCTQEIVQLLESTDYASESAFSNEIAISGHFYAWYDCHVGYT